ncbi:MAG TPA: hypothetical protein VKU38_15250 [Ktedonobacteraceae bacterium]|nr:hypothetical protein [Ktedonobacteraceae bacterium]
MSQSEVARIRQQIEMEQQAAWLGLYGLAQGTAKHEFINAKMERIWELRDTLVPLVGENEASRMMCESCEQVNVP